MKLIVVSNRLCEYLGIPEVDFTNDLTYLNGDDGVKIIGENIMIGVVALLAWQVTSMPMASLQSYHLELHMPLVKRVPIMSSGHTGSWTTPFSLSALNGVDGIIYWKRRSEQLVSVSSAGDVNR